MRNPLRTLFAYGFFDRAAYVDDESRIDRTARTPKRRRLAEAGTVLLQNIGRALPLDPKRQVAGGDRRRRRRLQERRRLLERSPTRS